MAEHKRENTITFKDETEKSNEPLNEHVSDIEGKLTLDELSLGNDYIENTDESATNAVYHQQYDAKITEKAKYSSETIISPVESFQVDPSKKKTFFAHKNETSENEPAKETLCKPCLSIDIHVPATHFCKTCDDPEPLCETCAKYHIRLNLCKDHKICGNIREFPNKEQNICENKSTKLLCEPCFTDNLQIEATHFCKTCDDPDPLCETCAKHHLKQKLSKDHEMCADIEEFRNRKRKECENKSTKLLCEPCLTDDLRIEATHYCKTCDDPDPLCETCAKHHLKQKLSKDHEMCADIEEFRNRKRKECENKSTKLLCEPCFTDDLQIEATHFCKTCDDPDPLCETCAKHHLKQKLSKDHEMCADIKDYRIIEQEECKKMSLKLLCEPCSSDNLQVEATHYCKTCDDPDPLCETCAKHHLKQKLSKDHEMCTDIKEFRKMEPKKCKIKETEKHCGPCSDENKQITATHFCKTCDDPEPLCESCAKEHIRHKISKDHKLSDKIEEFPQIDSNVCKIKETEKHCGPCSDENKQITATHFCKTCDDPEPLCETCAKEHIRHKISKDHEISDKIEEFPQIDSNVCSIKETEIVCEPCFNDNKQIPATSFCKTCADPEPLCENCAKQHIRQKISKEHKICLEIREYPKFKPHSSKHNGIEKVCGSCSKNNVSNKATYICKTCDDQEPLCERCAEQHIQQEMNKDHKFSDQILLPKKKNSGYERQPNEAAEDTKSPGKPSYTDIKSNSVTLFWQKSLENATHYQVRYKCLNKQEKWKFTETDSNQNHLVINGLMAKTQYTFQVRGIFEDVEGPYGPMSECIETRESLATKLLGFCERLTEDHPSKYRLPAEENIKARNEMARTKQLIFGKTTTAFDEKTILLIGATGSGKSTLVDGFVNYIMGVSFDDPFRFTTAMLESEEMKTHNQAVSQTEWITVYKIHPNTGSRLNYTLNIIDTPGFGDTRGIERDNAIVDQIRHLFCSQGADGVLYIDAVCFIVKAPDARLTVVQKYVFSSMLALFGKDIESNICTLITFADGAEPPVLASLRETKLPHTMTFTFNNSALFAKNNDLANNALSPMFWEMGCRSFERFFNHIKDLRAASLCQTKDVLEEREQLKFVLSNIRPQITAGLSKLSELKQKLDIFQRYKSEIESNQNFEYTVEEMKQRMLELQPGQHVTNCLHCNVTCHEECRIPDDEEKKRCWAMDSNGYCRICPDKCEWSEHKNTKYVIKYVTEKVTKTYAEMKERYEEAIGQTITHEKYIEDLTYYVDDLFEEINSMMNEMNRCKTRLKEIALRPDPLSAVEHIDLMIQSEQEEKQPGYLNRVKMLKEFRKAALVGQDVEDLSKNIQEARENTKTITGKSFERDTGSKMKTGNIVARGYRFLKNLF